MEEKFDSFMETVDGRFHGFVNQINEYLTENGCKCDIKLQKSGYVVSYTLKSGKKTLATFVSRKTGMKLRIYPEHIQEYQSFLDTFPEKAKKEIRQADAESDRRHKIAGLFCKAFERAVLLTPTEENVRIWTQCTRMTPEEIEDNVKEARELAEVFSTIAGILESLLPGGDGDAG